MEDAIKKTFYLFYLWYNAGWILLGGQQESIGSCWPAFSHVPQIKLVAEKYKKTRSLLNVCNKIMQNVVHSNGRAFAPDFNPLEYWNLLCNCVTRHNFIQSQEEKKKKITTWEHRENHKYIFMWLYYKNKNNIFGHFE